LSLFLVPRVLSSHFVSPSVLGVVLGIAVVALDELSTEVSAQVGIDAIMAVSMMAESAFFIYL
jgi:hypothetical protein